MFSRNILDCESLRYHNQRKLESLNTVEVLSAKRKCPTVDGTFSCKQIAGKAGSGPGPPQQQKKRKEKKQAFRRSTMASANSAMQMHSRTKSSAINVGRLLDISKYALSLTRNQKENRYSSGIDTSEMDFSSSDIDLESYPEAAKKRPLEVEFFHKQQPIRYGDGRHKRKGTETSKEFDQIESSIINVEPKKTDRDSVCSDNVPYDTDMSALKGSDPSKIKLSTMNSSVRSAIIADHVWPLFYLSTWFAMNIVITLYCKAVFAKFHFPYPMLLTAIHMACTSLGVEYCRYWGVFKPAPSSPGLWRSMLWFSFIFTANIWLSNASLLEVSVNLHQVVRTIIPLITMVLSAVFFGDSYPWAVLPPVLLVIAGVACAVWSDVSFTAFGLFVVLLGCFFSSLKGIVTQKTQVGALGLSTLDLLGRVCPLAVVELLVMACLLGEVRDLWNHRTILQPALCGHLIFLGLIAFSLNFVSFRCAALLNPLTLNIAGNCKQVLTCLLGIGLFGGVLTSTLMMGIFGTAIGAFWYFKVMSRWKQQARPKNVAAQDVVSKASYKEVMTEDEGNLEKPNESIRSRDLV